jgi:hypothetical protein
MFRLARWFVICAIALGGCTTVDPLDQRGETVNRNATDYANDATLLNIVRATLSEPLTFITITGLDGTQSATGNLGLPTFTLGPHLASSPRNFGIGPNSLSRTNSNTFHISVVDDPGSYAALLSPVNPAMIAFFMRQGYSRALLFFLLTDELRQVKVDGNGNVTGLIGDYVNNPNDAAQFGPFITKMANLLNEGLVAQLDVTATPSGHVLPPSKLCIDPYAPRVAFAPQVAKVVATTPATDPALCENAPWIEAQPATAAAADSGGGKGDVTGLGVARDGSLWAELNGQNKLVRISPNGKVTTVTLAAVKPTAPPKATAPAPAVAYQFLDAQHNHYQIFLRSTYGAYNYIGAYLNHPIDNLLTPDASGSGAMIEIQPGSAVGCFAQVEYRDVHYCVPANANHSKRLFALLHQLQQIQTAPSNAPTTLTVVPVP